MQNEEQNKMLDGSTSKTKTESPYKDVTIKAVSLNVNDYHFPGAPDFQPISIRATSIEEAEQLWKTLRKPVKPEAKVEETKEKEQSENE